MEKHKTSSYVGKQDAFRPLSQSLYFPQLTIKSSWFKIFLPLVRQYNCSLKELLKSTTLGEKIDVSVSY